MPSVQHTIVRWLVPVWSRTPPGGDRQAIRAALITANRSTRDQPPRSVSATHQVSISNGHGFPVYALRPDGAEAPRRTVFYLHGGGYVHPADARHWIFATRLADALGAGTVLPAYPLAPEFTVEDSFAQMLALFGEVAARSPDGVVLAGDSAGGGYALALAQALRDQGGPVPERLVLIAPWVDLTGSAPGTDQAAQRDPWLSLPHLPVYASFWAGTDDPERLADPRISPGLGDLGGLPPALMLCGTRDVLHPGCEALFDRAQETDWSLDYAVAPGLLHVYPLLPIPEARVALEQIVEFCTLL